MVILVTMVTKLKIATVEILLTLETNAKVLNLSIPCIFRSMYSVYFTNEMLCNNYIHTYLITGVLTYSIEQRTY